MFLYRVIFLIQGCAVLLTFNLYMVNSDYFISYYFESVMTIFSTVFLVCNLIGLLYMTIWGYRKCYYLNITSSYLFFIISIAGGVPVLNYVNLRQEIKFGITICILAFTGFFTAILEGEIMGLAYKYDNSKEVMVGIGIIGLLVSIVKIISKLINHSSILIYFMSSVVFLSISMILVYFIKPTTPSKEEKPVSGYDEIDDVYSIQKVRKSNVVNKSIFYLQIFWTFFVTMSVYPGICTVLNHGSEWYPVVMVTLFTLFDFLGRWFPMICHSYMINIVYTINLFRIVLFVTIYILFTIWFNDVVSYVVIILLALTNGYCSTIIMKESNDKFPSKHNGNLMMLFMLLGISSGSMLSIGIYYSSYLIKYHPMYF